MINILKQLTSVVVRYLYTTTVDTQYRVHAFDGIYNCTLVISITLTATIFDNRSSTAQIFLLNVQTLADNEGNYNVSTSRMQIITPSM